jgi:thioredoxin 1
MMGHKLITVSLISISLLACQQSKKETDKLSMSQASKTDVMPSGKYKLSFIELGSVRCIPCRQMQKVIKSVKQEYGNEVRTIFIDVVEKEGKPYAELFKINTIPVQVFLDKQGKEVYRHEGYLSKEEVYMVLNKNGISKSLK